MPRKSRKDQDYSIPLYLLLAALVLLAVLVFVKSRQPGGQGGLWSSGKSPEAVQTLQKQVYEAIRGFRVQPEKIQRRGRELQISLPADLHPLLVYDRVSQIVRQAGGTITQGYEDSQSGTLTLVYALDKTPIEKIILARSQAPAKASGAIAIVIDDFGYNMNRIVRELIDFPYPITYAIIPGLPYSHEIADSLNQHGKSIIVHMPMEPMSGRVEADGYTLLTALPAAEIHARVRKAIADVPYAVGMNNHMGSKATADSALMRVVLSELHQAGFFFIDSHTSAVTVGYKLAPEEGVPVLFNSLFLDAVDDPQHVEQKLARLARIAAKDGFAVGIGHPKQSTLAVLKKNLPGLQAQGFRFVEAQSLLSQPLAQK